jgi:sugar-specific transcriptional regulator TrmB
MSLKGFGFTGTQSVAWAALAGMGDATGYAVARRAGIARANIYHALDALVVRGLASTSGGRPATYRAMPPHDVLARLTDQCDRDLAALAQDLGIQPATDRRREPTPAAALEMIVDRPALMTSAARCVSDATFEILAVVGPWAPEVSAALARARRRPAVTWKVVALGAPAPDGALLRPVPASELVAYWGGLPVAVLADRTSAVCGTVDGDRCDGVATTSPGLVPFLRHLLRRELASVAAPRVS